MAIDGPAGSGKSAVGRRLASALELPFVDSGLFYRALACAIEEGSAGGAEPDPAALALELEFDLGGDRIRAGGRDVTDLVYGAEISARASTLAQIPKVRSALLGQQRSLAHDPGVVMAGRDIGTVVLPWAEHKFFLTAGVEERARRRERQLRARGLAADEDALKAEISERDRQDTERAVAPLRPAADATVVETEGVALEAVVARLLGLIRGA
ncbi:MAG TPA: (d)CMP kinase [Candidatus Nitrosotalea sp.]|nr:(d)CMP kinase [Candidatus Nitrosotalea sp.]